MSLSDQKNMRFFISANTGNGFYSLYDNVFQNEKFEKIYVIHGGPGTGKSTLMRKIGMYGKNRGAACEEILCSSDPESLDGVILKKNGKQIGVIDGTAPHPRIFSLPGVKEELWDLGAFWDERLLCEQSSAIEEHNKAKKKAYKHTYALLHAAESCHNSLTNLSASRFDMEKLTAHLIRQAHKISLKGRQKICFMRAFSMRGEKTVKELLSYAKEYVFLCGKKHAAEIYLSELRGVLEKTDIAHTVYLSPLSEHEIDAIYIEECERLIIWNGFSSSLTQGKKIHMNRFFKDSGVCIPSKQYKVAEKLEEALMRAALSSLEEAGKHHFALEEIYKCSMHFDELREASDLWCKEAIDHL